MNEGEALRAFVRVAESSGVSVLLIGAKAREIVFDHRIDGQAFRATRDVDFGVRTSSPEHYEVFIEALVASGVFLRIGPHKLTRIDGTEVDVVPFGGIADEQGNVTWLDSGKVMSVRGFEAAETHREAIDLDGVRVEVVTLAGLIVLKLYALRDRVLETGATDLHDLAYILHNATEFLNERVLASLGKDLIASLSYEEWGPYLLGRDVAKIVPIAEARDLAGIIDAYVLVPPDYVRLDRAKRGGDLDAAVKRFAAFKRGLVGADQAA